MFEVVKICPANKEFDMELVMYRPSPPTGVSAPFDPVNDPDIVALDPVVPEAVIECIEFPDDSMEIRVALIASVWE
jgi:hypothetical protein